MGQFDQQSVSGKGGVAWVKQVAASMDPGLVEAQIQAYQQAVTKLAEVQKTLQNVKTNLAATWTGDAAEQAQQSFQQSINHAQATQETISGMVVPTLQSAKATQATFVAEAAELPDEQPVPSTSAVESGFDWITGQATGTQLAQAQNIRARSQAAQALNALSDGYEHAASRLTQATGRTEGGWTGSSSTGAFDLGSMSSSSGNGAASRYSQRFGGSGSTGRTSAAASPSRSVSVGPNPRTTLASTSVSSSPSNSGTVTDLPTVEGTSAATAIAPVLTLIEADQAASTAGGSQYNRRGVVLNEPGTEGSNSTGLVSNEDLDQERSSFIPGVFDETGFGDGQTTDELRNDGLLVEQRAGSRGGILGEGELTEIGIVGGADQRFSRVSVRDSNSAPGSYLDPVEEADSAPLSQVRSAFEDATDAWGNPVDMMTAGRRRSVDRDQDDERGKRPKYLKEHEFWNSEQRIVPPVIE